MINACPQNDCGPSHFWTFVENSNPDPMTWNPYMSLQALGCTQTGARRATENCEALGSGGGAAAHRELPGDLPLQEQHGGGSQNGNTTRCAVLGVSRQSDVVSASRTRTRIWVILYLLCTSSHRHLAALDA